MKKKQLWLALALGLVLVLLCAGSALAATDSLKFNMELSSSKFSEPKTITVSFTVTNVGDSVMPGPVTLYYPSGKQVEEFGEPVLDVGSSKNWSGPWSVTQKELEAGKISFIVRYSDYDENGELKQYASSVTKHIQYAGAAPELDVSRTIVPQTAQEGQDVSIIYEITNKGSADVTGVTIREDAGIAKDAASVGGIKAGETAKHTFTVKMGKKDLTSAATVTYKAGGKTYTSKVDADIIKYGKVNLSATLSSDKKGGAPGDIVKLTLKLKNSGKTDITDINVADEKLGTVFSGQTVKAGETLTLEKDLTVTETQELLFKVTANDDGAQVETATGTVKVIATDPTQQIALRVEAEADRDAVYQIPGGVVRFTITVYNDSAVDVENITLKAVDLSLYTFEKIPAGGSAQFVREMEISMPGSFQFTANVKDQLGQTASFPSNAVKIAKTNPPADPTPTPIVLPAKPTEIPDPAEVKAADREEEEERLNSIDQIAGTAKWILAAIAGVLLLLLLIGAVRRAQNKSQSNKAIDHLPDSTYRDYSVQPKRRRRSEISNGSDGQTGRAAEPQQTENTVQNSELMAETLQRVYSRRNQETAAEAEAAAKTVVEAAKTEIAETAGQAEAAAGEATRAAVQSAGEAAHRRRARK